MKFERRKNFMITFGLGIDRLRVSLLVKAFQPVFLTVAFDIMEYVRVFFTLEPSAIPIEVDWVLIL